MFGDHGPLFDAIVDKDVLRVLLEVKKGTDVNKRINVFRKSHDQHDRPTLLSVAILSDEHIANMLIDAGADVHAVVKEKNSLSFAVMEGHLDLTRRLIGLGVDVELPNDTGDTLLQLLNMSTPHAIDIAIELLKYKWIRENINKQGRHALSMPALHSAAIAGNVGLVKLLLEYGADPMLRDRDKKLAYDLTSNVDIRHMLSTI